MTEPRWRKCRPAVGIALVLIALGIDTRAARAQAASVVKTPCAVAGKTVAPADGEKSVQTVLTATAEGRGATTPGQSRPGDSRTVVVPPAGCVVGLKIEDKFALPDRTASFGWRLLAQSVSGATAASSGGTTNAVTALIRVDLRSAAGTWLRSSDVPAADQQFAVPLTDGTFDGTIEIRRQDLDLKNNAQVRLTLFGERLEGLEDTDEDGDRDDHADAVFLGSLASFGNAFRTELSDKDYRNLTRLGVEQRHRVAADGTVKTLAYRLVSELASRRIENARIEFATRTEPLVLFVGIAGLSRLVLLDCQAWGMPAAKLQLKDNDCERLSEPWQSSFERASHFWVAYVEDEQAPFDTSIDIEFGGDARPESDDFDAQNVVRMVDQDREAGENRRVRFGYRRFALPGRANVTNVTISRQGSNYGLRSWSRSFIRYGPFPMRVAGGLAAGAWWSPRTTATLNPVYGSDPFAPEALEVAESSAIQPVAAMIFFRFTQMRAAAEQVPFSWRSVFPDFGAGIALPWVHDEPFTKQTFIVGLSWELSFGDRVHLLAGAARNQETLFHVPAGIRVPTGTPLEAVGTVEWKWRPILAVSFDLVRTP